MTLSVKHQAFIDSFFLHNFNATEAYCDVYGVDRDAGAPCAARLLSNVKIAEEVRRRVAEKTMCADEVLIRLADIARGDIADLMEITPSGFTFKLLIESKGERATNPKTKLIRKIKQKVTTIIAKNENAEDREIIESEIELYSALDALDKIGKHHSLFLDRDDDGKPIVPITTVEVVLPPEDTGDGD